MVYVLNQNGQPLMPTENHAKLRFLSRFAYKIEQINEATLFFV